MGSQTHTLTVAQLASHAHSMAHYATASENGTYGCGTNAFQGRVLVTASYNATGTVAAGGNAAHNNLQPTRVVNKIIKY